MIGPAYMPRGVLDAPAARTLAQPRAELISAYSTRNLGDAAIMRAIAGLVPDGLVQVKLEGSNELYVPGLQFGAQAQFAELRISVGGDIFNNSRPYFVTRNFLSKLAELGRAPRSTIAFGQTIPASCRGMAFSMLASVLKRLPAVVVRDVESWKVLRDAGVTAKLSWDVAFTTEVLADALWRAQRLLEDANLKPERTALISVRPFDALYPGDQLDFESNIFALARSLMARGHDVAILVQSDVASWDEDRSSAKRISAADPRIRVIDCIADTEDPDPVATLTALLSLANIAVGVRYHTTVLRLAAGREPFNLFYSRKGEDLQRRLGLSGCPVRDIGEKDIVAAIEATAQRSFDPEPLKTNVRQRFSDAQKAVGA